MRNGFFYGIFALVVLGFGISFILGYKCYTSNDPNSMACYMISDLHDAGVGRR